MTPTMAVERATIADSGVFQPSGLSPYPKMARTPGGAENGLFAVLRPTPSKSPLRRAVDAGLRRELEDMEARVKALESKFDEGKITKILSRLSAAESRIADLEAKIEKAMKEYR